MEKIRVFPYPERSFVWHSVLFTPWLVCMLVPGVNAGAEMLRLILCIGLPVIFVPSLIWVNAFGWNAPVIFEPGRIRQRRGREIIVWRWEDLTELRPMRRRYRFDVEFRFSVTSSSIPEKLVFRPTAKLKKHFSALCKNPEISGKFYGILKDFEAL